MVYASTMVWESENGERPETSGWSGLLPLSLWKIVTRISYGKKGRSFSG